MAMNTYRDGFNEVQREAKWTLPRILIWLLVLMVVGVLFRVVAFPIWFAGRAMDVVQQQIDPAELLRKYELFKDESAQLDAKLASIHIKEQQVKSVQAMPMDRTNREQLMIWQQELGGMKYSFNALAADYNAQMAKINYRFCNVGDLPKGASEPLPREYKQYQEN
jgi:hypothetical protein